MAVAPHLDQRLANLVGEGTDAVSEVAFEPRQWPARPSCPQLNSPSANVTRFLHSARNALSLLSRSIPPCEAMLGDYDLPLHIGVLFVLLATSGLGVFVPVVFGNKADSAKTSGNAFFVSRDSLLIGHN